MPINPMESKTPKIWRWRLHRHVAAFTTTRQGGYSQGEFGQMNINPWVGDDPEAVRQNRLLLSQAMRLRDPSHIILPHQVHGTEIRQLTRQYLSLGAHEQASLLEGIDAVMTDVPAISIGVSTADCIPLLLYDHEHHAACAIHAGWRGCVKRIIPKAVSAMRGAYATQPAELRALIGPGIAMHSYQVRADVIAQFRQAGLDTRYFSMPTFLTREQQDTVQPADRTWQLDLPMFCRFELEDAGLRPRRIVMTMEDTFDKADEYFSARRQGIACGRIYTGIIL